MATTTPKLDPMQQHALQMGVPMANVVGPNPGQGFRLDPALTSLIGQAKIAQDPKAATGGGKPGDPSAPSPTSLKDQIAAFAGTLGLSPDAISSIQQQYQVSNLAKPAGMSDADWKVLQPLFSSALQSKAAQAAQQPAQLAMQAFFQDNIKPYLEESTKRTTGELQNIFGAEQANLANIPASLRGQYAALNQQNQADALGYLQGLGQQAVLQPSLDQTSALLQQLLAQSQATQKTLAQQGAISGAQALQAAVPGANPSIPVGF